VPPWDAFLQLRDRVVNNTETVEPLTSNGCVNRGQYTDVVKEQLCGHVVSPATREHAIMEETFSVRSVPGLCNED
jgi:hypothetical protein